MLSYPLIGKYGSAVFPYNLIREQRYFCEFVILEQSQLFFFQLSIKPRASNMLGKIFYHQVRTLAPPSFISDGV